MARQPIFDRNRSIVAFELLFRNSEGKPVGPLSSQQEAAALAQSVVEIGLDKLVGQCTAFINIPIGLLSHPSIRLLPPERVVLEVLEDVDPTSEVIDQLEFLRDEGYKIALDDFVFDRRLDALLPHCDIVKVEYPVADKSALRRNVARLKSMGLTTLTEKVEEPKDHRLCMSCGFDLFQGYFFAKPELVPGSAVRAGTSTMAQLLQELQNPTVSIARIEELLACDARLTHQLLRVARSASMGGGSGVTSIRAALLTTGTARLAALVGLMIMAERSGGNNSVLMLGTIRAKLCEDLARQMGLGEADRHFTVGLLSVLDAVLGIPMSEVLKQVPLAQELQAVLLDPTGPGDLCTVLRVAKAIEKGDWLTIQSLNLDPITMGECYLHAIQWSEQITSQLAAAA